MVDIHNHILFGVDDGPKTLDDSIEMIKKAKRLGFKEFYLTSHFGKGKFRNVDYDKNFDVLEKRCKELDLNVVLHKGNEVYLDENIHETLNSGEFHVIGENYLLVEFAPLTLPSVGKDMLKRVKAKGYTPILAHIERYVHFRKRDFLELKSIDVKLQINVSGINFKNIEKMLKKGEIDFIASDAHGIHKRGYDLDEQLLRLRRIVGEKGIRRMTSLKKEELGDEKKNPIWIFRAIATNLFRGTWFKRDLDESREWESRGKSKRVGC